MSPLLDARDVATQLKLPLARLRRMAERGEYPELLRVTRGEWRVRASDHEAWVAGNWTSALMARSELLMERARAAMVERRN